jgi:hypothetical protein
MAVKMLTLVFWVVRGVDVAENGDSMFLRNVGMYQKSTRRYNAEYRHRLLKERSILLLRTCILKHTTNSFRRLYNLNSFFFLFSVNLTFMCLVCAGVG